MTVYAFAPPRLSETSRDWLGWVVAAFVVPAIGIGLAISWPQQYTTWPQAILIVIAVGLSAAFAYRISSVDRLLNFGFAAAILAVLGPYQNPVFIVSAWSIGVLLGHWARSNVFTLATESALYNGAAAFALIAAWSGVDSWLVGMQLPQGTLLAELIALRVPQIFAGVLAFYVIRVVASVVRMRILTRLRTREALLRTSWLRLMGMFTLEATTATVVFILATQLNSFVFQTTTPFGRTVLIVLVSTVAFGISGRAEARTNHERLDSLVSATLQLPWPGSTPVHEQAAVLARRALPQFEITSSQTPVRTRRDHVQSVPIEGDGPPRRLIAMRRPGKPPFRLEDQQILDAIAQIANETIRARKEVHSLRRMANTDRLTGLLNYRAFQATLDELSEQRRDDSLVALIFIDIDNFKSINDTYGHEAGNAVLQTIAKRIDALFEEPNLVARVGGDEFVVLLQGLSSQDDAEAVQQQLRDQVTRPVQVQGSVISIRISQGVAYSMPDQQDLTALVELADRRMYASRGTLIAQKGEPPAPETGEGGGISQTLRDAILQRRLQLVYQPIVDLHTNQVVALEALVRYRDARHGLVSTDLLLGEAARFHLLGELSSQVIEGAMSAIERVHGLFPALHRVHVNVTLEQILDSEIQQIVRNVSAARPELQLVFEVNEQSLRHSDPERIARAHTFSRQSPASLAIDDIGRSHTGLPALRDYHFNVWKVDRNIVLHFENARSVPLVTGLLRAAEELSASVIFEGVETSEQDAWLRQHGARYAQGYLYGRPLSLDELLLRFETGGLAAQL